MSNDNPSNDQTSVIHVIGVFSEFWSVVKNQRRIGTDRRLAQLMTKVTTGLPVGNAPIDDAWARYFLLLTYQHDTEFTQTFGVPIHNLAALINQLIHRQSSRNHQLGLIHGHLDKPNSSYVKELCDQNRNLLIAYLQKPTYYAARKLSDRLGRRLPLEDCFQIGSCIISQPFELLKPFEFDRDNTIKTFVNNKLPDKLRDEVADRAMRDNTRNRSKAAQLKHGPRNRQKILASAGYANGELERYNLLWGCYREIHHPQQEGHRQLLPDPTVDQWQQIAACFNQRLRQLTQKTDQAQIDGATAEGMMNDCWQAVQDWSKVKEPLSLDAPLASTGDDESPTALADLVDDQLSPAPDDALVYQEVEESIAQACAQLSGLEKAVLALWQGLDFGQDYVIALLGKPKGFTANSGVSRIVKNKLSKALLASWRQDSHHGDAKKLRELHNELAKEVAAALNKNLPQYCRNWLFELLASERQTLVHLYANGSSSSLRDGLKQRLLDRLHITKLEAVPDADQRITAFIDSWLQAH